jgi:Tol biopolymer transport system component
MSSVETRKRCSIRSVNILLPLAVVPLLGCDGNGDWLRRPGAAAAYAAPLASDTSVVTTRRMWSWSRPTPDAGILLDEGMVMPNGTEMASTDWETGDPVVFDLASREFRRFRFNGGPYETGVGMQVVPSPDGSRVAVRWHNWREPQMQLRIFDVVTGESRTIMTPDTAIVNHFIPVAWTPAGDSVFASLWPSYSQGGDVKVVLIPAAGGTPRLVHTIPKRAWPGRMSLSSDGRWLLYDHDLSRDQQSRSDIYIIDVQDGGARPLVEHPAVDLLVGWLPDTEVALFSSDRSGTTDLWSVRVVNGIASAEPRRVRSEFFRSQAVGFGNGALFYRVHTGSTGPAVINMDPRSGALRGPASPPLANLSGTAMALAWSPDGQTLAGPLGGRGSWPGPRTITLHSMQTGERRVFWLGEDVYPLGMQWSADGKALFLRAGEAGWMVPTGPHHFLRLDLVTGTTTRLFSAEDLEEPIPTWRFLVTPDGRSIILRQQRTLDDGRTEMTIVLRSLEDGSERELHRTSGFIPEFSISADGTQLAFVQQVWEDKDSLFVMRMDASQPLRTVASWVYDEVSLLGWLPAGNAVLGARLTDDGTGEEILRIELDGSTSVVGISPFRPRRGAPHFQGANRSRLVLSPAGNRLAHVVNDIGEELWRMDGLHDLFARDAIGRR